VPLAMRVLFILSPVMYPVSLIEEQGAWIADINPLAVAIEGTSDVVYRDTWPDFSLLGFHALVASVCLVGVFALFRRLEPRMSDFV
jgi:ABC-type polysaccharide/polyol phosphate export permease